ncbi:putative undecaprenyl-phosphate N-acetylglucosaminyl 1-phosphate transferase [compost metagenome]
MLSFSVGLLASFLVTLLIVKFSHLHGKLSADTDLSGAQKFHTRPVPRIGGVSIVIGAMMPLLVLYFRSAGQLQPYALLICAAIPAFVAGLAEDMTKRISPRVRLIATMASALLACWLLDARVVRIDIPFIDDVLAIYIVSVCITALAVAGLANAVNIIDGFNGLAAIVTMMMLMSMLYVAYHTGDTFIVSAAAALAGAILGFFFWNYPGGLIFLGDGGAYFIGFILAELSILLVMRNSQVSAWYPVLMFIYPIFETLFSIYRKKILRGMSPGIPDGVHLHMLVYKRLMRWAVGSRDERHRLRRNSLTSPYLWLLSLVAVLPASLFWNNGPILLAFVAIFVITYVWLYWRIVRFRAPRWLIIKKAVTRRKPH